LKLAQLVLGLLGIRGGQKFNFHDSIYFFFDPIHLKSFLLDVDFNLIYILYILLIGYLFSEFRFSKWIIHNIQSKFSIYIFS